MPTLRLPGAASLLLTLTLTLFGCSAGSGNGGTHGGDAGGADGRGPAGPDASGQDVASADAVGQDATPDAGGQDATVPDASGQDSAPQDASGQDSTAQDASGQDSAAQDANGPDTSPAPDAAGGAPVAISFDGDHGPGLAVCQSASPPAHCGLPEMNVAANGTQVVQITWQHVSVYDYAGTLLSATPLPALITSAGLSASAQNVIEPHVVYDEFINRWIITATCAQDCLLVSASSDATGTWGGAYVDGNGNDPSIHLGYDKNGVYLEENQPGTNVNASVSTYAGTFFAIPSAELQWVGAFNPVHKNRVANKPIDGWPAVDQNTGKLPTDPAFFAAKTCPGSSSGTGSCQSATDDSFEWVVTTVTWSGTTAVYSGDQLVKTGSGGAANAWLFNTPIAAVTQLGSATQLRPIESHRLMNASQNGSHLYGALGSGPCTGSCGAQGVDATNLFFWFDLDCTNASACVVSQTGKVSDPTRDLAFPTIGVGSNGNVAIVAAAIGPSTYPSIEVWTHKTTDPPGAATGPTTVIAGTAPDSCVANPLIFANAVGVSTVRDPMDPTKLWTTHQYASSAAPCVWATRVMQLAP